MTLDPRLSSMRLAQLKLATELAARGWPPLVFSEVLPYPCVDNRGWLVVVETEAGEQIVIGFTTPFAIDCEDTAKIARLNQLFWDGCRLSEEHAAETYCRHVDHFFFFRAE